jgi:hypothetical protein
VAVRDDAAADGGCRVPRLEAVGDILPPFDYGKIKDAAAKAIDILRTDLADFGGFVTIVGEAGREFTIALREAV